MGPRTETKVAGNTESENLVLKKLMQPDIAPRQRDGNWHGQGKIRGQDAFSSLRDQFLPYN